MVVIVAFWSLSGGEPPKPLIIPTLDGKIPDLTGPTIKAPPIADGSYRVLLKTKTGISIPVPDEAWVSAGMPVPSGFKLNTWIPTGMGKWSAAWEISDTHKTLSVVRGLGGYTDPEGPLFPDAHTAILTSIRTCGMPDYVAVIRESRKAGKSSPDFSLQLCFYWEEYYAGKSYFTNVIFFTAMFKEGQLMMPWTLNDGQLTKQSLAESISEKGEDLISMGPLGGGKIRISH
jgi:hypothetical protein